MNNKTASTDYSDYFLSTMQSLLAHTVIIAFLLLTTDFLSGSNAHTQTGKMTPKVDIVQGVTIDETAVTEEISRLEVADRQQKQVIAEAKAAKQELEALKHKQEKAAKEEKQKLAQLKLQAEKERDALKALQQKKILQEKELKALNEKKLQEQAHLKKVKEQQIAEEKKQLEQQKLAQEKAAQQERLAKAAKEAKERQALLAAKKSFIESKRSKYISLIQEKMKQAWILPGDDVHGLVCEIEIQMLPDGSVVNSKVVRSSGNFAFDRATEAAVSRASPLPIPDDKDLISEFRHFKFTFDPSIT
jgi:colicin import membrane protein